MEHGYLLWLLAAAFSARPYWPGPHYLSRTVTVIRTGTVTAIRTGTATAIGTVITTGTAIMIAIAGILRPAQATRTA